MSAACEHMHVVDLVLFWLVLQAVSDTYVPVTLKIHGSCVKKDEPFPLWLLQTGSTLHQLWLPNEALMYRADSYIPGPLPPNSYNANFTHKSEK